MKKEILYRGKRVDTQEWVEGYYFCMVHNDGRHEHHFIIPLGADLSLGTPIEKIQVEVDPETVCLYTGQLDKYKNKIYENDICMIHSSSIDEQDGYFVVEWDNDAARFVLSGIGIMVSFDNYYGYECEVIGNIFDNKELLETADEWLKEYEPLLRKIAKLPERERIKVDAYATGLLDGTKLVKGG